MSCEPPFRTISKRTCVPNSSTQEPPCANRRRKWPSAWESACAPYVDLERGKSCCSLITYLFYLRYCSKNAQASLNEVLALLPPADSDESETKS